MYQVKDVVCDYGVFRNGELIPELILNSRSNAELIAEILTLDEQHKKYEDKDKPIGPLVYPDNTNL